MSFINEKEFPMDNELLEQLLSKCKTFSRKNNTGRYVAFENNADGILPMAFGKILAAFQFASEKDMTPLVFNQNRFNEMDRIYHSFGIKTIYTICDMYRYPIELIKALFSAALFLLQKPTPEKLISKHYGGILVGDLVYDEWLRNDDSCVTIRRIAPFPTALKRIVKAFFLVNVVKKEFKKHLICAYLAGNTIYTDAIYCRLAYLMRIPIIQYSNEYEMYCYEHTESAIVNVNDQQRLRIKRYMASHTISSKEIKDMLDDLYAGKGDWNNQRAFLDKTRDDRITIMRKLGLDVYKKNVVIMAHCFSDAPHYSGSLLFRDYYEELEEVLKHADTLDNVNWLLKAHPCRFDYGEAEVVEEMYQRCCPQKIVKWLPDEYSAEVLCELADIIITIQGTGGVEFACSGIPCIITANPYYDQFGFTKHVYSRQELFQVMDEAERILPLTEAQRKSACNVLYAYKMLNQKGNDPVCAMVQESYHYYMKNHNERETNDVMLRLAIANLTEKTLSNSSWIKSAYF